MATSALSNPYFGDVVHGVDRHASAAGYSVLPADTHDEADMEVKAVSELLRRRVSAIILAASSGGPQAIRYAHRSRSPSSPSTVSFPPTSTKSASTTPNPSQYLWIT
ncbi:hypothetical protein [Streptomyces sp. NPDC050534]|uniref:hypothetical protein n=1 Tax=Streptomyces sp. NPDC050534 TaxID=3365625 RepID=UPI00378C929E